MAGVRTDRTVAASSAQVVNPDIVELGFRERDGEDTHSSRCDRSRLSALNYGWCSAASAIPGLASGWPSIAQAGYESEALETPSHGL